MIRFLKERSGYKEHSRYSIALREGLPDDVIEENPVKYDTIKRLKKLSEKREQREKEMEKVFFLNKYNYDDYSLSFHII